MAKFSLSGWLLELNMFVCTYVDFLTLPDAIFFIFIVRKANDERDKSRKRSVFVGLLRFCSAALNM